MAQNRNVAASDKGQKLPAGDEVPWLVSQVMVEEEALQTDRKQR